MSLHVLASGALISDPQRCEGLKGTFTTAALRAASGEVVSIIAFSAAEAERLLDFVKGDAVAVGDRGRLTSWTGHDGAEKHGISVLAAQIASRQRRCHVYENIGPGYVDDDGGLILVDQIIDFEAAVWLCTLVNAALGGERAKRGMRS